MERSGLKHKYDAEETHSKRRRISVEVGKKDTHNKCEQKGRQKINDKINELKDLLPECQSSPANKAAILRSAADSIKRFQFICYQLYSSNVKMEEENRKIHEEIARLRGVIGLAANESLPPNMFDSHSNGRVGGSGGNDQHIKPELVDPSRFISTNNISIRQDNFSLYTNPISDAVRSYKIAPNGSITVPYGLSHDPNYEQEEEEEEEDEEYDEKESPAGYSWK